MKKIYFQTFLPLAVVLLLLACSPQPQQHPDAGNPGSLPRYELRLEGDQICLTGEGEETCLPFRGAMVKLYREEERLRIAVAEESIPDLRELPEYPGLKLFRENVRFEIVGEELLVHEEDGSSQRFPLDGGDIGLFGTAGGDVGVAIACVLGTNLSNLTKDPCSGTIYLNPTDIKGQVIINSDIGTMIIVDAYDTLNLMFRNLNPSLLPEFVASLKVPALEIPRTEPLPIDPLEGEHYYLVGGETIPVEEASICEVPCPFTMGLCDGKLLVAGPDGHVKCSIDAGKCPVTVYMKDGKARIVPGKGGCL